jgi:murein hydrolase activator
MLKFLFSLIFICSTTLMWSQETAQEKLERQKAEIQQKIRDNEKLLQNVKKSEKKVLTVVVLQSNKIKLKENLINTTEKQKKVLGNNMFINQVQINKLKAELDTLKTDYAKMIVKSYKSRSEESRAMFLLSSENFLQAYKRAQYMKQYTNYRKAQGEEIQSKSTQLLNYNARLNVQKLQKQKLIVENEKEKTSLEKEKQEQERLLNELKKEKGKIAAEIKKKRQESRNIDRQIDRLIREAIAEANRKAALERAKANPTAPASTTPVSTSKIVLTPEAKILADNFKANRGRLPFPVEKGYISLGYGDQPHPVYKTLIVHNSGVEITTEPGSSARSVFEGEVTSVMVLSPVNKAVMIQHGDYFTVYQNLSSVSVSKGDKVSRKQTIGRIRTNSEGKAVIKFLVLQNTTYTNPDSWLSN